MTIICKIHGEFKQSYNTHVNSKSGCKKCTKQDLWSRSKYIKYSDEKHNGKAKLYIIKCFNENEEFYKIGITVNSIQKRYNSYRAMPYNYEIVVVLESKVGTVWDLEKILLQHLKEFNYTPKNFFDGSVKECFNNNININKLIADYFL